MKSKVLLLSLLFTIVFSYQTNAQCTISTTPIINSSALTCGTAPLIACGGILYIGDGTNPTTIFMNSALDLTCLGPIQLIVRNNGALDFSAGNDYLTLAAGSSILFQAGSNLIGGSCNASERIYIGTDLIASCNGNGPGADYSFLQLLGLGGYNIVKATVSPTAACGSGIFTLTADPVPGAGATIKWYTVPSGGVPFSTTNPYVTPSISSTTIYYVEAYYSANGVTTPRISVTATVNPLPTTPAIGTITQPTCVLSTGSVVLNGLPAVGTWTLTRSGTSSATTTGTGTSTVVSGLAVGTYNFTVSNGTCTSLLSANVVINAPAQTVWNGVSWSVPPTALTNLVFNNSYSSTGNLDGCNCTVNIGSVVFNAGHTLSLIDAVTVAGGSLTFNNTASLLQVNNTPNSGNITYIRNTSPVIHFDYTYWSSPTTGFQTLLNFSPNTLQDKFFTYNNVWTFSNPSTDTFTKGIGYAIRAPQGTSPNVPTVLPHQFVGVPNNGNADVAVALGPPSPNRLIGNPYPSTLDADAFINANIVATGSINQTISGTLYFWTHNHTLVANNYSASDYATYNLSGGTAVSTGTGNTTAPTKYITAGQGFFISTVANGNISFRNNMRTGANNTNFYKNGNTETPGITLEKHRIWLNLTNKDSNFSQTLLSYIQTATNDYNSGFDGLYFGNNQFAIYSLLSNDAYAIQARALPFSNTDAIPIGFIANTSGDLSIAIDHLDGLFLEGQKIYLEDKLLKTINDITNAPYLFTANKGTTNDRFVLRYVNQVSNVNSSQNIITVFASNDEIKINSSLENIKKYTIYSVLGQIVVDAKNVNTNQSVVNSLIKNNQTLIVKIVLENGQTVTKKIIF